MNTPHSVQDAARWQCIVGRDREADGTFWYGVVTTGIYCRPQCASRPRRQNVRFFDNPQAAVAAGFRPCRRCHPDQEQTMASPDLTNRLDTLRKDVEQMLDAPKGKLAPKQKAALKEISQLLAEAADEAEEAGL